jgi:hypothetical protein
MQKLPENPAITDHAGLLRIGKFLLGMSVANQLAAAAGANRGPSD